ncbi:hypothetical protein HDU91_001241, partial [Kappamyces sp. JEL0680]
MSLEKAPLLPPPGSPVIVHKKKHSFCKVLLYAILAYIGISFIFCATSHHHGTDPGRKHAPCSRPGIEKHGDSKLPVSQVDASIDQFTLEQEGFVGLEIQWNYGAGRKNIEVSYEIRSNDPTALEYTKLEVEKSGSVLTVRATSPKERPAN